jgi:hypothetical protein
MKTRVMSNETTMDTQHSYYILIAGMLGLAVGILTAKPKHIPEAVLSLLAGLFACFVIAPTVAEICTNLAVSFTFLSWLKATPDTSLFVGIVGICGMLGMQIVIALKGDFWRLITRWAAKRIEEDGDSHRRK